MKDHIRDKFGAGAPLLEPPVGGQVVTCLWSPEGIWELGSTSSRSKLNVASLYDSESKATLNLIVRSYLKNKEQKASTNQENT